MASSHAQVITKTLEKQAKVVATAITPDGKYMAGVVELNNGKNTAEVRIWDTISGTLQDTFAPREFSGDLHPFLSYSSDGVWLAQSSRFENTIYLRNTKKKQTRKISLRENEVIKFHGFVPDSNKLVGCVHRHPDKNSEKRKVNDSSLTMWDVSTGEVIGKKNTYTDWVYCQKDSIVTLDGSTFILWDSRNLVKRRESKTTLKYWMTIRPYLHFDKNHSLLAFYTSEDLEKQSELEMWDTKRLAMISRHQIEKEHHISSASFSPDGKMLAEVISRVFPSKDILSIREVATGKQTMSIDIGDVGIPAVYFLASDKIMIHEGVMGGGTLSLWNLTTQKKYRTQIRIGNDKKPYFYLSSFAISNDLRTYALGGAYTYKFDVGVFGISPRVYEGQIKIIDLKAFLEKADAEDKVKTKK